MTATLTLPAGKMRKLGTRRARIQDDVTADYLAMVVKPGDRTIQIGASDLGAVCLQRGARHEIAISCFVISILRRSSALRGPDLGPAIFFISHISHMEKFHVESPPREITSLLPLPSTPPCPQGKAL